MKRTCQTGAGPAGRTASVLGRCTCCSSSQSPAPAAQPSDSRHGAASRSQRFSSPAGQRGTNVLFGFFPTDFGGGGFSPRGDRFKGCGVNACYFETLFGSEEAGGGGVVLVELQQHVFQPVAHPQRELDQLGVHARGNDWRDGEKRQRLVGTLKRPSA